MKPSSSNEENHDVENAKLDKVKVRTPRNGRVVKLHNQALLSGLAYCFSSCGMILVNKLVLSSYDFNAGISLMLYQVILIWCTLNLFYPFVYCVVMWELLELDWFWHFFVWMQNLISVAIVSVLSLLGLVSTEPLTWRLIKVWLPVNFIFVGMLVTSMFRYAVFNFMASVIISFSLLLEYIDCLTKGGWLWQMPCDWLFTIQCFICY